MAAELKIVHDSRNPAFRFPIGAVEAGGRVRVALSVEGAENAETIVAQVRVWRDGAGETLVPMTLLSGENTEEEKATGEPLPFSVPKWFVATIDLPDEGGLLWYYFIVLIDQHVRFYGNTGGLGGEGGSTGVEMGVLGVIEHQVLDIQLLGQHTGIEGRAVVLLVGVEHETVLVQAEGLAHQPVAVAGVGLAMHAVGLVAQAHQALSVGQNGLETILLEIGRTDIKESDLHVIDIDLLAILHLAQDDR